MGVPANSMWAYVGPRENFVEGAGGARPIRMPVKALGEGLKRVTVKMSKNGQCLPIFLFPHPGVRSLIARAFTGLSVVFHIPLAKGTPLAITVVDEFQQIRCTTP